MSLKFSIEIPLGVPTPGEFQTLEAVAEMGAALENSGFEAAFVTDHPSPDTHWLHQGMGHDASDPFAALAFLGSVTHRLKLQTNIIVAGYRNPFLLAKCAATVQTFTGGRLILGLGAGYQKVEFDALGSDFKRRGKLFDEALEVLRLAWKGGPVSFKGMDFDAVEVEPRPAPSTPPQIWIGGSSEAAQIRAGKYGDGWCPIFASPGMSASNKAVAITSLDDLKERMARVEEVRASEGRTGPFELSAGPPMKVGWFGKGDVNAYVDALGEFAEAGVTWVGALAPHDSRAQFIEAVEWYDSEVIAKFR
ncbi:MAG: TIGR03619 family F420-dependent LLM class oxidoreductase [Novosphingobium sp.]|nr:TIGR03619 family F420-dependent LLM class oxidoreductase [Novosphingobium sp.]